MMNFFLGLTLTVVGGIAAIRGIKLLGKVVNRLFDFVDGFLS